MTLDEIAQKWLAVVRKDIAEYEQTLKRLREHERQCVEAINSERQAKREAADEHPVDG